MNNYDEIQKIMKSKYMEGPKYKMKEDELIGINYFSGSKHSAFYEIYGPSTIYRLVVIKPSENLFTSSFVGKNHLLLLLLEEEKVRGGFISLSEEIESELVRSFDHLPDEQIEEISNLWGEFIVDHYNALQEQKRKS